MDVIPSSDHKKAAQATPVIKPNHNNDHVGKVWCWNEELRKPSSVGVPVWSFKHAPLALYWSKLAIPNMLVETKRQDEIEETEQYKNAYWIARVVSYAGYLGKIVYEGYDDNTEDETKSYWAHFCHDLHRIGYCADNNYSIVPPQAVVSSCGGGDQLPKPQSPTSLLTSKQDDVTPDAPVPSWREWIIKRVTGGYTMHTLVQQLLDHDMETQLMKGTEVEVLDKFCVSRMRVGYVIEVVGHRVHVRYWDTDPNDKELTNSFWCHEQSDSINVVGWSKTVGHEVHAPPGYDPPILENTSVLRKNPGVDIQLGMKLEVVDPLKLSTISAATVVKVLKFGYFMVRIDSVEDLGTVFNVGNNYGNNWFCYHVTSPLIFRCGFCKENNIHLQPPIRYERRPFDWNEYFKVTGSKPLPLPEKEHVDHSFVEGAKLEAVDVMEPNLICVATVARVVGRLLRIRFDGWNETYDQWADATSCDLFPIGWCQLVDYALQPPHLPPPILPPIPMQKIVSSSGKRSKSKLAGSSAGSVKSKRKSGTRSSTD